MKGVMGPDASWDVPPAPPSSGLQRDYVGANLCQPSLEALSFGLNGSNLHINAERE